MAHLNSRLPLRSYWLSFVHSFWDSYFTTFRTNEEHRQRRWHPGDGSEDVLNGGTLLDHLVSLTLQTMHRPLQHHQAKRASLTLLDQTYALRAPHFMD